MRTLFINCSKILTKDVKGFASIDHSIFDWESLKRLLRILKRRNPNVMLLNLPAHLEFSDLLEFWINNCYPGELVGFSNSCSEDLVESYISQNSKGTNNAYYSIIEDNDKPITEKDETLAIFYLKE